MTQDYEPGDNVIWTNPTPCREFEATIVKECRPQSAIRQSHPNNPGPQSFPAFDERECYFEIRVQETGKTMPVPISQLRRANQDTTRPRVG